MSIYTNVQATRGAPLSPVMLVTNQPVQIDNASEVLSETYGHPSDLFHVYIEYTTVIFVRGDLVTDLFNLDPLTGQAVKYRVVGRPKSYPDGHVEMLAYQFTGPEDT